MEQEAAKRHDNASGSMAAKVRLLVDFLGDYLRARADWNRPAQASPRRARR